jgi:Fe-S-cluster-containing dehydrogenase component
MECTGVVLDWRGEGKAVKCADMRCVKRCTTAAYEVSVEGIVF